MVPTKENISMLGETDERDLLHILPLSMVPIHTPGLKHARLIKNCRLENVIELFDYKGTGSGQLRVDDLADEFDLGNTGGSSDEGIIRRLCAMQSYDVYSLRITLRRCGIQVQDSKYLQLSEAKMAELSSYMTRFTRPLIEEVFGEGGPSDTYEHVLHALRSPDTKGSIERLKLMAKKLNIKLLDIPLFLEEFSDIYLSLSYYRHCLDDIKPSLDYLQESLDELMADNRLKQDHALMESCAVLKETLNRQMLGAAEMVDDFSTSTAEMWTDLTAEKFTNIKSMIQTYHGSIGGILCMLTVKIKAWEKRFPDSTVGGPLKRAEFVRAELSQDIEKIANYVIIARVPTDTM